MREFTDQRSRQIPKCTGAGRIIMKVALNIACARTVCAPIVGVRDDVGGVITGDVCNTRVEPTFAGHDARGCKKEAKAENTMEFHGVDLGRCTTKVMVCRL